ncbi:MAG TPA: MerR family transcriptional regulator [Gemmatimonadota bacterium]|nr:MerR family transcriptional regulator [Gemmatimonadota bacterium]
MAQRTGLSPHVIRVWERRYGAVTPERLPNGYRQYSEADIDRLRGLRELTEAGHGIGDVADLDVEQIAGLLDRKRALSGPPRDPRLAEPVDDGSDEGSPSELTIPVARASVHRAMRAWDAPRLATVLRESAVRLPLDAFLEDILVDLLQRIGHEWETGELTPAREHMVSALVPGVLAWVADRLPEPPGDAPLAVFATPASTRHDVGIRMVEVLARQAGWRTLFLGADLPAAEIVRAAAENQAALVALSVVYPVGDSSVRHELELLVEALGGKTGLLVGGAAAPDYADVLAAPGVETLLSLDDFRSRLTPTA